MPCGITNAAVDDYWILWLYSYQWITFPLWILLFFLFNNWFDSEQVKVEVWVCMVHIPLYPYCSGIIHQNLDCGWSACGNAWPLRSGECRLFRTNCLQLRLLSVVLRLTTCGLKPEWIQSVIGWGGNIPKDTCFILWPFAQEVMIPDHKSIGCQYEVSTSRYKFLSSVFIYVQNNP